MLSHIVPNSSSLYTLFYSVIYNSVSIWYASIKLLSAESDLNKNLGFFGLDPEQKIKLDIKPDLQHWCSTITISILAVLGIATVCHC